MNSLQNSSKGDWYVSDPSLKLKVLDSAATTEWYVASRCPNAGMLQVLPPENLAKIPKNLILAKLFTRVKNN